jgi:hypothetical protein
MSGAGYLGGLRVSDRGERDVNKGRKALIGVKGGEVMLRAGEERRCVVVKLVVDTMW